MSRLASTWFDPVLGLDLHFQLVLRPPIPPFVCLFPHPFVGLVFDPIGLLIGLAISNAIGAVTGQGSVGPVLVNGLPVTTAGTNAWGLPVLHWPYMGAWVPFPRVRPPIRPGDIVKPDLLIPPNDSIIITGSDSVYAAGATMSRMGDIGLSCSDPVRLPFSLIIAIPKGAPVLVGGGIKIDFLSAAIGVLSSRFITTPIRSWLGSRLRGIWMSPRFSRLRNLWDDLRCFFTGHPVDVATGRLTTSATDWTLRGSTPLAFTRTYSSCWAERPSAMGYGWSHSFEESVWLEWGRIVYRTESGREIEIPIPPERGSLAHDVPVFDRRNRLSLELTRTGTILLTLEDGSRRRFERTGESTWRLASIERLDGTTTLHHDSAGRLARVTDPYGREVELVHDDRGRLTEIWLPSPDGGPKIRRAHYKYSVEGDLVEIEDAAGRSTRYEYVGHLLVRETDRDGRSFYFGYDGRGAQASCVRTWGDGGVIDHEIVYDRDARTTHVTDSVGALRSYRYDERFLVTAITDPSGRETTYEYDEDGHLVRMQDPAGNIHLAQYDERGRLFKSTHPDGTTDEIDYDAAGRPLRRRGRDGRTTTYTHDVRGSLVGVASGDQHHFAFQRDGRGQITGLDVRGGPVLRAENGAFGLAARLAAPARVPHELSYDHLGRLVALSAVTPLGTLRREYDYDVLDRVVKTREGETWISFEYDAEGKRTRERTSAGVDIEYEYGGPGWLVALRTAGRTWQFERDREGRLTGVVSPAGERHSLRRDMEGLLRSEETFDGRDRRLVHDDAGGVSIYTSKRRSTRITKDARSRTVEVRYPGGAREVVSFDTSGKVVRAESASSTVTIERDHLGLPVREIAGARQVEARYDGAGRLMSLSLSSGSRVEITRDADGRITSVSATAGRSAPAVVKIERDPTTLSIQRSIEGGLRITTRYDERGRRVERGVDRDTVRLVHETFVWQEDLLREARDDVAGVVTSFEYGSEAYADRMLRSDGRESGRFLDILGRPHRRRDHAGRWYAQGSRLIQTEDGASYTYDALGRLVQRTDGSGGSQRLEYDDAERLTSVTDSRGHITSFEYDALGRRIRKHGASGITEYTWFDGRIVEERGPQGVTHYLWDPAGYGLWGTLSERGATWFLCGPHEAPEVGFDATGRVVWRATVDLWGAADAKVQEVRVPWRFPGQYEDVETGLYYNGHRYYDPAAGRYTTPDPLGLAGGLDPYGYVTDPLRQIDPQGLNSYDWKRLAEWGDNQPLTLSQALARVTGKDGIFGFGNALNRPLFEQFWARGATTPQVGDIAAGIFADPHGINFWMDAVTRYEMGWIDNLVADGGKIYFLRNPGADYFNGLMPSQSMWNTTDWGLEPWSITSWESMYLSTHQNPNISGSLINVILGSKYAMPPP